MPVLVSEDECTEKATHREKELKYSPEVLILIVRFYLYIKYIYVIFNIELAVQTTLSPF